MYLVSKFVYKCKTKIHLSGIKAIFDNFSYINVEMRQKFCSSVVDSALLFIEEF